MALTKLKECPQELWLGDLGYSSGGVCYYMCEYVRETLWGSDVKKFDDAVAAAKKAIPATIVKAGKAKNMRDKGGAAHGVAQAQYPAAPANLQAKKVYKVGLWFGDNTEAPTGPTHQNHEVLAITGAVDEVVLFEPNFGFYHATDSGSTLKDIFEDAVRELYGTDDHAENFHYQAARSIS